MYDDRPFDQTLKRLRALKAYADNQPGENTQLIDWELEAFKKAQWAFIDAYRMKRQMLEKEYEIELLSKIKENNQSTQKVDKECNTDKLHSEIKDVHHDDEGQPWIKWTNADSDSGLSSDSDSDSDNDDDDNMPTKTRIVRRKPKN